MLVVKTARDEIMTSLIVDQVRHRPSLQNTHGDAALHLEQSSAYLHGAYELRTRVRRLRS